MSEQCLDRGIDIKPTGEKIIVKMGELVVAETDTPLELHETGYPARIYIPRKDVNPDLLVDSETNTFCPFKGTASYHSIKVDGDMAADAVWYYPDPCPQVAAIKDHVSFWGNKVEVLRA